MAEASGRAAGVLACAGVWPGLKDIFAVDSGLGTALQFHAASPAMQFPTAARERIAIASYPFRDFILGRGEKNDGQQQNTGGAGGDIVNGASASRRGGSGKMELKDFAAHVSAKFNIKKIEPWSEHFRSLDKAYLEELRAAVAIGSPSVRTNIPRAKDSKPDLERTVESVKRVAEYGAAKNVVVNLENDNPVSEDPFFLVKVIEKVNSPWLHALPDFANTLAAYEEEYAYRGIDAMFGHAYNISHVKEMEVGDGKDKIAHVDLARTFGIAKKHEYKGYFSMEWDSPGDPYAGTAGLIEKTLKNLG